MANKLDTWIVPISVAVGVYFIVFIIATVGGLVQMSRYYEYGTHHRIYKRIYTTTDDPYTQPWQRGEYFMPGYQFGLWLGKRVN